MIEVMLHINSGIISIRNPSVHVSTLELQILTFQNKKCLQHDMSRKINRIFMFFSFLVLQSLLWVWTVNGSVSLSVRHLEVKLQEDNQTLYLAFQKVFFGTKHVGIPRSLQ